MGIRLSKNTTQAGIPTVINNVPKYACSTAKELHNTAPENSHRSNILGGNARVNSLGKCAVLQLVNIRINYQQVKGEAARELMIFIENMRTC